MLGALRLFAALAETLRIEAGKIGSQSAGRTPDELRRAANAAAAAGKFDAAQALAAAAITTAPKDPANWLAYAGVAIWADDAKADGRGSSSPGGRPRPTPPTSIPPRLTRRPRRWPRSATFSPATKSGAARSTP